MRVCWGALALLWLIRCRRYSQATTLSRWMPCALVTGRSTQPLFPRLPLTPIHNLSPPSSRLAATIRRYPAAVAPQHLTHDSSFTCGVVHACLLLFATFCARVLSLSEQQHSGASHTAALAPLSVFAIVQVPILDHRSERIRSAYLFCKFELKGVDGSKEAASKETGSKEATRETNPAKPPPAPAVEPDGNASDQELESGLSGLSDWDNSDSDEDEPGDAAALTGSMSPGGRLLSGLTGSYCPRQKADRRRGCVRHTLSRPTFASHIVRTADGADLRAVRPRVRREAHAEGSEGKEREQEGRAATTGGGCRATRHKPTKDAGPSGLAFESAVCQGGFCDAWRRRDSRRGGR